MIHSSKIIGICLGFQLLFTKSYEFEITKGLGILNGDFISFNKKISDYFNVENPFSTSEAYSIKKIIEDSL